MNKFTLFSLTLTIGSITQTSFGMLTIAKRTAFRKNTMPLITPYSTIHTKTINPNDYGIDQHYQSLISPQHTLYYMRKFLDNQPQEPICDDTKQEIKNISEALLHQAHTAKKIHSKMNTAIDRHNKNISLLQKISYSIATICSARYTLTGLEENSSGDMRVHFKENTLLGTISHLWKSYHHSIAMKRYKNGIIEKKMPHNNIRWGDSFKVVSDVIRDNKNQLSPYKNTGYLTSHFLYTEQKDIDDLKQTTKELEKLIILNNQKQTTNKFNQE